MYYDTKQCGRRIKEARRRKGYTQAQLSFLSGMEENSMARIECGIKGTSIDRIMQISEILDRILL
jgi:transcriptional regulator with XRE-family HTH domain